MLFALLVPQHLTPNTQHRSCSRPSSFRRFRKECPPKAELTTDRRGQAAVNPAQRETRKWLFHVFCLRITRVYGDPERLYPNTALLAADSPSTLSRTARSTSESGAEVWVHCIAS